MNKREKGSIIVYVMFIISVIFLLISVLIGKVEKNRQILVEKTDGYLHYLSVGGLEKACELINRQAGLIQMKIPSTAGIEYKFANSQFDGGYFLSSDSKEELKNNIQDEVVRFLEDNYKVAHDTYQIIYNLSFDSMDADDYEVKVIITCGGIKVDGQGYDCFKLASYVKNLNTNIVYDTNCILGLNNFSITESYYQKTIPDIFQPGLYSIGEIKTGGYRIHGGSLSETNAALSSIINNDINLSDRGYDKLNNVIIGTNIDLDVSTYNSGIIINKGSDLDIRCGGGDNIFNGVIISLGGLNIHDEIIINGPVVVAGNVYLFNDVTINPNSDIIYDISINDNVLKRKVFDFLKLTSYSSLSAKDKLYPKSSIENSSGVKINTINNAKGDIFYIDEFVAKRG
ncbi:MAG: hypothetical protein LBV08_06715 [Clostridiales bacterium]|jgi:hypothetical protein|nr:hypothetical protein [Clostridiales bacterium]